MRTFADDETPLSHSVAKSMFVKASGGHWQSYKTVGLISISFSPFWTMYVMLKTT